MAIANMLGAMGTPALAQERRPEFRQPRIIQGPPVRVDQFTQMQFELPALDPHRLETIEIDPEIIAYVAQLDDPVFEVREAATRRLIDLATDPEQLYAVLHQMKLTPEQRYRALAAVRHKLLNRARGALGVQMQPDRLALDEPPRIRIVDLVPRLPAERVLQIDDLVTHIDGRPITRVEELQDIVQSKSPGARVKLSVQRPRRDETGQKLRDERSNFIFDPIEVELDLGSAELLRDDNGRSGALRGEQTDQLMAGRISLVYAPPPQPVRVRGGTDRLATLDPIDLHPVIQHLAQERELVAQGRYTERQFRERWERELQNLIALSEQTNLSPADKALLREVIRRYVEVMEARPR